MPGLLPEFRCGTAQIALHCLLQASESKDKAVTGEPHLFVEQDLHVPFLFGATAKKSASKAKRNFELYMEA